VTSLQKSVAMSKSGPSPRKLKRVEEPVPGVGSGSEEDIGSSDSEEDVDHDDLDDKTLNELDNCQSELDELNAKEYKEIIEVEAKYNKLKKPCYEKRGALITKVPNFWGNVISNYPHFSMLVTDEENDCLAFLTTVEFEYFDKMEDGYRIKFFFRENPFFENEELVKELRVGVSVFPKSASTVIKWKPGMDLSKRKPEEAYEGRKRGSKNWTFFSWFSDNENPDEDDVAEIFKDDLWINPKEYFFHPEGYDSDGEDQEETMEERDQAEAEEGDDKVVNDDVVA